MYLCTVLFRVAISKVSRGSVVQNCSVDYNCVGGTVVVNTIEFVAILLSTVPPRQVTGS